MDNQLTPSKKRSTEILKFIPNMRISELSCDALHDQLKLTIVFASWGHVNPIGPRACYDEGKRIAETLTYGFHRQDGVDVRVARIFNTYGERFFMSFPSDHSAPVFVSGPRSA